MALTVAELKEMLADLPDDLMVVFDDETTEYIYGVEVAHTGPDHIALTWDLDEYFIKAGEGEFLEKP